MKQINVKTYRTDNGIIVREKSFCPAGITTREIKIEGNFFVKHKKVVSGSLGSSFDDYLKEAHTKDEINDIDLVAINKVIGFWQKEIEEIDKNREEIVVKKAPIAEEVRRLQGQLRKYKKKINSLGRKRHDIQKEMADLRKIKKELEQ